MADFKRLRQLAGIPLNESEKSATDQKDWIIYDFKTRNLFCIAVVKDDKGWHLVEFVNYFGMTEEEFQNAVSMGYYTMLDAALNRDAYNYVIAKHTFDKSAVDTKFWHNLVSEKDFWKKATVFKKIDGDEFEAVMAKLVPKSAVLYEN